MKFVPRPYVLESMLHVTPKQILALLAQSPRHRIQGFLNEVEEECLVRFYALVARWMW